MTKIKFCGLSRYEDIETANMLHPDYVGFVFAEKSKRFITPQKAYELKKKLAPDIAAVGVFVNEDIETAASLLKDNIIDFAQLHGQENNAYISALKKLTAKPVIQAFCMTSNDDLALAEKSIADYILLDSGAGTGKAFDWKLLHDIKRPYFLAGGLNPENVSTAIQNLHPFAVDVSSGIEVNGIKNKEKMTAFIAAVRKEDNIV